MNPEHCLIEREGHVLTVTLNRPEAKNALSAGMLAGMYRAWRRLDDDPELRVAILTGRGDVFCAGADLKAMGAGDSDDEFMQLMSEVPDIHWQALLRHNQPLKPIIAAVPRSCRVPTFVSLPRTPFSVSPKPGADSSPSVAPAYACGDRFPIRWPLRSCSRDDTSPRRRRWTSAW